MGFLDVFLPGRREDPVLGTLVRGWGAGAARSRWRVVSRCRWRSPAGEPLFRLAAPDEVWAQVTAVRVLIERMAGRETVGIAYRAAWDEEHTLGARFQAWELVELNGSVLG